MSNSLPLKNRMDEIDFIKGVMIFLMVMYHIHYVDLIKPFMSFLHLFRMPVFLFFTGFLLNMNKPFRVRINTIFRSLIIPYIVFEIIYILSLYLATQRTGLKFQNSVTDLSVEYVLGALFVNPIGAYWYLHTITQCLLIINLVSEKVSNQINVTIISGIVLYLISMAFSGFKFENCLFLLIGYYFKRFSIFIPFTIISILPILLIAFICFETAKRSPTESIALTFFTIPFLGALFKYVDKITITHIISLFRRNTLIIFLLHPFF